MYHNRLGHTLCTIAAIVCGSASVEAAYSLQAADDAANRLASIGIITAVDGELRLDATLTRASHATILVRAAGQSANAQLLNGSAAFPDTAAHWASGNIAMFKALTELNGYTIGLPDGRFGPDMNVTAGNTVYFLSALMGLERDATKAFPASLLDPAVANGFLEPSDAQLVTDLGGTSINRGFAFYLTDAYFSTPQERYQGESYYTHMGYQVPEVGTAVGVGIGLMLAAGRRRRAAWTL